MHDDSIIYGVGGADYQRTNFNTVQRISIKYRKKFQFFHGGDLSALFDKGGLRSPSIH